MPDHLPSQPSEQAQAAPASGRASQVVVGLFAKHWTPGKAKTRLAATLGDDQASEAARLFLEVTLRRLSEIKAEHTLAYTPEQHCDAFSELVAPLAADWRLAPQPGGTLGERMRWFFESALVAETTERGGDRVAILFGSDSPDFPLDAVRRAVDWLSSPGASERLVLGPAQDGGYWLIGARGAAPPVLDDMPWSEPDLLRKTLERLDQLGWKRGERYELVDEWCDIDTEPDLRALGQRLTTIDPPVDAYGPLIDFISRRCRAC